MAAPIRNNAVAAIWSIATTAVTNDRVIWNSRRNRNSVNPQHETIIRRHSVDAVGQTLQLQRGGVGHKRFLQGLVDLEQRGWRFHQHRADAPDPVAGEIRTAVRSGHEDHAPYFSSMLEDDRLLEEAFTVGRHLCLCWGMAERLSPEFCSSVGNERSGDASTHAVADNHHRLAERKYLFDDVEFLSQDSVRVRVGIPAGLAEDPKLVIAPAIFV